MDKEQFDRLIARYGESNLGAEEKTLLEDEILEAYYERMEAIGEFVLEDEESIKETMLRIIRERTGIGEPVKVVQMPKRSKRTWVAWAASIAAVLVVSLGTYFLFFQYKTEQGISSTQPVVKNDVAPGGNKAVLTLGNGQQIILDSAHNGTLALQGNTKVVKTDSGRLSYNTINEKPTEITYNTLSTPRGGQYQLSLPDGSKVWLNAASSIKYPVAFAGKERVVEVTGEAYFEVVHNVKMPFMVKAGSETLEDIGTAFNVNAYANEASQKTTLIEGSVRVIEENKQSVILKPNEQAIEKGGIVQIEQGANTKEVLAWKNGQFFFHEATMEQIMRQVERWYDVDVEYKGTIPTGNYNGHPSRNLTLNQMLEVIRSAGVKFSIEGKKIIIE